MATIQELETELSRIAQLVQTPDATVERDTLVLTTPIYLNPTADELQISGYSRTYFIADRAYEITSIREAHDTLQSSADGAALQIAKMTGTTAPSIEHDGLNMITTAAYVGSAFTLRGFDLKGVAVNTVTNGTMTNQVSTLRLAAGNRLVWGIHGTIGSSFISLTTVLRKV